MNQDIVKILKNDGVGVIPTDTIYGVVGKALSSKTVERIYQIKHRTPEKPSIILISDLQDLKLFNIDLNSDVKKFLQTVWPNPVSVILPCDNPKMEYLHRGTKTLAFRLPDNENLQKLLAQTGPLIVPSANPEGEKPAETIDEAKKYFGNQVDFYVDGGKIVSQPSTLIKIDHGQIQILREGAFKLPGQNYL